MGPIEQRRTFIFRFMIQRVVFKFSDKSEYTVKEGGDTIYSIQAHKVMYALMNEEREQGKQLTFNERVKFIIDNGDKITSGL